jgi:ElaB/YqjD/DUF883 family membrane-anchored ribosome-binding protein
MNATAEVVNTEGDRVTSDKLMADLRVVAADMEQLLKATASQTGQHVAQARARAAESLKECKARVIDLQEAALAKSRAAGRATDDYVRANPWQAIAIGAIVGLAVGSLLACGRASDA